MRLVKRDGEVFFKILPVMFLVFALIFPSVIHAARPFITDDSGTTGKNGFQIESGIEYASDRENEDGVIVKEKETGVSTVFTYGIKDDLDVVLSVFYLWKNKKEDVKTVFNRNGLSDMTLEAKWRFYEKDGLGIALKPGISIPTGDYKQGFGTGKIGYGAVFIASYEFAPFGFHFNGGYRRNENKIEERRDLFCASLAVTYEALKDLTIGGDIGISSNACPKTKTTPTFLLFGANYKIGKHITIDGGVKFGLNRYEVDQGVIGGITLKF